MNCRPGDLAVFVGTQGMPKLDAWALGRIVKCIAVYQSLGYPCWRTEPTLVGPDGVARGIADVALRPIRDPGDDAKDELLRPLPKEVAV